MRIYELLDGRLLFSGRTAAMSDEQLEKLRERGVSLVVNMWHTPDPRLADTVDYIHHSIPDGRLHGDTKTAVEATVNRVVAEIERGGKVLVHCYGGRNRSCLVAALALRRVARVSGPKAVEMIRTARPKALFNYHFDDYLSALD